MALNRADKPKELEDNEKDNPSLNVEMSEPDGNTLTMRAFRL